jgi:guanylate kinase
MKLIKFLLVFFIPVFSFANPKFLLIAGPSGIGKSTTIKELQKLDDRFVYIKPFTTRPLRASEIDKIHMPLEEMLKLQEQKKLAALNYVYGNYYATPLDPILEAFASGAFPILDWPIEKMPAMKELFKDQVVSVYLYVDEIEQLSDRLNLDSRDPNGKRLESGRFELESFFRGEFDDLIDYKIRNSHADPSATAKTVYEAYLSSLGQD